MFVATLDSISYGNFIFFFIYYLWFPWNDPVNEEIPNSTYANFKGFPGPTA